MGVVYYSNYFVYFEVARTECFRELGLIYTEMEQKGMFLVVCEAFCKYISPVRYDDVIEITASFKKISDLKLRFDYRVHNITPGKGSKLLSTGYTTHVFVGKNSRPIKIPSCVNRLFK